jgi:recombination protein RecR
MTQVMKLPRVVRRLSEKFERLPGIGPKSAQRIVFYLLHNPESELLDFAEKLVALKRETCTCGRCHNIAETDPCEVCSDVGRDEKMLCVVEQPLDLIAIERAGKYHGFYHVLHGCIDPLNHVGPEQLYLNDILRRLEGVEELILATNPTMEGEATALYIKDKIEKSGVAPALKITRIGHGLPVGANIEYADGVTLNRSFEGRQVL